MYPTSTVGCGKLWDKAVKTASIPITDSQKAYSLICEIWFNYVFLNVNMSNKCK